MQTVKYIEGIGRVVFVKSRRNKRILLTVKEDDTIRVSMPYSVHLSDAETFIRTKKDWIEQAKEKIKKRTGVKPLFTPEKKIKIWNRPVEIIRKIAPKNYLHCKISEDTIRFVIPEVFDMEDEEVQDFIKSTLIKIMRQQAKLYLPMRTRQLARKHGFKYGKVSIRKAKTRWGSCSSENNISLNLHLMRLPEHLIEYVILHELCHTVHKNHSKDFWNLLKQIHPESDACRKEIKNMKLELF